ncbi:MAG: hypothetical protein Q9M36_12215 [Sulfurovum sp.]|nr:hypothetical protein [Sulfurovum sp.]
MTIRKNFLIDQKMAEELEKMAKEEGKTQTQITHEALEIYMQNKKREKRLEALDMLAGSLNGKIGDINIKKERGEYLAKKYGY